MKMKFNVHVQAVRLSVRQNCGNAAHRFQLAFTSYWCVLKSDVDHTWRGTSASLNYERFHGH